MELKESLEELRRIGERIKQARETILPLLRSFEVRGQSFFYHNVVPNGTLESLGQLSKTNNNEQQPRRGGSMVEWKRK